MNDQKFSFNVPNCCIIRKCSAFEPYFAGYHQCESTSRLQAIFRGIHCVPTEEK
jgi:hypothetical protein